MPRYEDVTFTITRDDGNIFVIDNSTWRIPNDGLEGWHTLQTEVSTIDNIMIDGAILTNQRVGAVDRTITAELRDAKDNMSARRSAEHFFLPRHSYTVVASYMGRERKCQGVQAGFKLSEGNIYQPITITWSMFCPDPYMTDSTPTLGVSAFEGVGASGMPYMVSADTTQVHDHLWNSDILINGGFITGNAGNWDIGFFPPLNPKDLYLFYALRSAGDILGFPRVIIDMTKGTFMPLTNTLTISVGTIRRRDYMAGIDSEYHDDIWVIGDDVITFKVPVDGKDPTQSPVMRTSIIIDFGKRPFFITDASGNRLDYTLVTNTFFYSDIAKVFNKRDMVFYVKISQTGTQFEQPFVLPEDAVTIESYGRYTGI